MWSSLSSQGMFGKLGEPPRPAGDTTLAPDTPKAVRDPWKDMSDKHEGFNAELKSFRAEVRSLMEAQRTNMEDRLRNLERLADAQGRALAQLLERSQGLQNAAPGPRLSGRVSGSLDAGAPSRAAEMRSNQPDTDRFPDLFTEVAQLRAEVEGFKGSTLGDKTKDQLLTELPFVPLDKYERDLETITIDREIAFIRAGFICIAMTDSGHEEKAAMFQQLKTKEVQLLEQRPVSDMPSPRTMNAVFSNEPQTSTAIVPVELQTEQPNQFQIEVDTSYQEKLGLTINSRDGKVLTVEKLGDGLIRKWNQNNMEKQVKIGDLIVSVNGVDEPLDALQTELQRKGVLRILMRRLMTNETRLTTVRV